jgi:hypothetical protein
MFRDNNCMPSYMNLCCWFDFDLKRSSHSIAQSVVLCSCHSCMISHVDFKYCTGSAGGSVSNTADIQLFWDVTPCCGRVVLEVSGDHCPRMLDPWTVHPTQHQVQKTWTLMRYFRDICLEGLRTSIKKSVKLAVLRPRIEWGICWHVWSISCLASWGWELTQVKGQRAITRTVV